MGGDAPTLLSSGVAGPVGNRDFGAGSPCASHCAAIPSNGCSRFLATSTASAFNGETYSTRTPARRLRDTVISRSMAERNAANVLPEPVGAMTNTFRPEWIAGHA